MDPNTTPGLLLEDQVMTWDEVNEMGIEEAPADIGPSIEEAEEGEAAHG